MIADESESTQTAAGWAALALGRWEAAREAFEAGLAAEETASALEGLSWAAWWLDDAETVFGARERAYRLYRHEGEMSAAARMATWLAADALDFHGAIAVASGWLQRAGRLLDPLAVGADHGWLAFHEGYVARLRNDVTTTLERATKAAEYGRAFQVPDLEMLGLALEGAMLVDCARVPEGMRCLDEATAVALEGEATIPISRAWACCFLVTACVAVRDYERAAEWCDRIADFAERHGSRYMLAFCRAEYGAVHLWRGRWSEAERTLLAALDDFASSRPGWSGPSLVSLAELRRRQGRRADALALLERAGPGEAAQVCRARLALDEGDAARAIALLERMLRGMTDRMLDQAPVLELLVHAHAARGELDEAASALAALREIVAIVDTRALRAAADVAAGVLAATGGEHRVACRHLEDAVDAFEAMDAPFEVAGARVELATGLAALGDDEAATSEARAALDALVGLGAVEAAKRARRIADSSGVALRSSSASVTPRERDVLRLLAEGLTNRQIAEQLILSEHTVHRHVTNILRKLDLPSRTAAATFAVRSGLDESAGT